MPYYEYKATDSLGNRFQDVVEAGEPQEVVRTLRNKGLQVNSMRLLKEKGFSLLGWRKKITADDLMLFNRHLSSIVNTNLPIVPGLKVLSKDIKKDSLKLVIEKIRQDIERGCSLKEAFSKHPQVFSEFYVNMIEAGEKSGNLSGILQTLSSYSQAMAGLKKKFEEALVYPIFVTLFAVIIVLLVMVRVVPGVGSIFKEMGVKPPYLTSLLISFSENLKMNLTLLIGIILGLVILGKIIVSGMRKSEGGKLFLDSLLLKLPLFGALFRNVALAQFCRGFGTLLNGGIPILQTLDLLKGASTNQVIARAVHEMKRHIREGGAISEVLRTNTIFPETLIWITTVGEKRGNLDETFLDLAEYYDSEVEKAVGLINRFIEPVIIIVLGVMVGCILSLVFIPMYQVMTLFGVGPGQLGK